MTEKDLLHVLVDRLQRREIRAALRYVEYLVDRGDPVAKSLDSAREDDEPLGTDELQALEEGLKDLAEGRLISHQEVCARLAEDKRD